MEPFIGTILAFGFNYAPKGWAVCNGALLQIRSNTALFALIGNYYGGDGKQTFALPNLQGRSAIGFSDSIAMGTVAGAASHTMTIAQMPAHNHSAMSTITVPALADTGNQPSPGGHRLAISTGVNIYSNQPADGNLAPFNANGTLSPVGGSVPIPTISPYLVMNYSIATVGLFPSRN